MTDETKCCCGTIPCTCAKPKAEEVAGSYYCSVCGTDHENPTQDKPLDTEALVKDFVMLISDYCIQKKILPTPTTLVDVAAALNRAALTFSFSAGEIQAKMEPLIQLMSSLGKLGKEQYEEQLKKEMASWPKA
jgi:hypothetical protein